MMVDGSTLNGVYFDSIDEIENYLNDTFLASKDFQLH